jgi:hypothetical protein
MSQKRIPLFPYKKGVDMRDVALTEEGAYSYTKRADGEKTIEFFRTHMGSLKKYTILDGTANVGSDTILFGLNFKDVHGIEYNPENFKALMHNVGLYGLRNTHIHLGDTTKLYNKWCTDILYLDPPWGGPEYKEATELDLYLGEERVDEFLRMKILGPRRRCYPRWIALKLPANYAWSRLFNMPHVTECHCLAVRGYRILLMKTNIV